MSAQSPSNNGAELAIKSMLDSKGKSQRSSSQYDYSDEYDRGQPRSTIAGYLHAMRAGDLALATNSVTCQKKP